MKLPFGIKNDEGPLVGLLWVQSVFIGLSIVAYESAATSLFLSAFEVSSLPLVYIGVSIVSVLLGVGYLTLERKIPPSRLFSTAVAVILCGMVGAWILIHITDSKWAYLVTMIWLDVAIVFLGLQFWSLSGLLFNVRQSKRLFGIIGSGEVAGVVIGGMGMPLLVAAIGTRHIFLWSAICLGMAFFMLHVTINLNQGRLSKGGVEAEEEELKIRSMFKIPYLSQLFIFMLFVVLSDYFVDFFFYSKVDETFPDEEKLASFLGPFFAVVGGFSFFAKIFLFNRIMKHFGVLGGLLTLPVAVAGAIFFSMAAYYIFPGISILGYSIFFVFIMLTKLFDLGLRPSILEPTISLLYQPFSPARRVRVESFTGSVIEPLSNGLTGVILLVLSMGLGWGSIEIAWATLGIIVIWIGLSLKVRKGYSGELTKTFEKRKLVDTGSAGQRFDVEALRPHLQSKDPGEVIYVLRLLVAGQDENIEHELIKALDNPGDQVVIESLHLMIENGAEASARRVEKFLEEKADAPVFLSLGIITICALKESEAVDIVIRYLDHHDPHVSRAAIVGLVKYGGISGVLAAGRQLETLISSSNCRNRFNATQILQEIGISSFYQPVVDLLTDKEKDVRIGAIRCAGVLKNPKLIPHLVKLLSDPEMELETVNALAHFERSNVEELIELFLEAPENTRIRIGIAIALGKIGGSEAESFLIDQLAMKDLDLRNELCESLSAIKLQVPDSRRDLVIKQVELELKLLRMNSVDMAFAGSDPFALRAVTMESDQAFRRTFDLLSLLGNYESIVQARTRFFLKSDIHRALAIEILDNVLSGDLRLKVSEAFDRILSGTGAKPLNIPKWMRRQEEELGDVTRSALIWKSSPQEILKMKSLLRTFVDHPTPVLAETASFVIKRRGALKADELTIGKVELLSTCPIFHGASIAELAELAVKLKTHKLAKGKYLIRQGGLGTSMFIMADGKVKVLIDGKQKNVLSKGAVIGELASLDPEPRSASVRTMEATIAYELEGSDLLEYMSHRISIAYGIFRALCNSIRENTQGEPPAPVSGDFVNFENKKAPKNTGFSIFEKNRALSRVSLFQGLEESRLSAISSRMYVKYANPGETIIQAGDLGQSMFILVDGKVQAHRGDTLLQEMEPGAVFGELSALDPEPRSASITAIGEVTVFQIAGPMLYDLMAGSPELITGIAKELCQRLRNKYNNL